MTPPKWRHLLYSGGDDEPRRIVVLETLNDVTEIAFCPPDVAITHVDYDEADEHSRSGIKEDVAEAEVERARARAETLVDEQAAINLLVECRELADRNDDAALRDRIEEVLEPVTAFICEEGTEVSFTECRLRREAGGQ